MNEFTLVPLALLCLGVSCQPITDSQRLFSIVASRVQHLHLLAQKIFSDFENTLQTEDQRHLNKIFLQDFCQSDYILSPIDKHETQRSSVLRLLTVSFRLLDCWEFPSRSLSTGSTQRNQISLKLSELKTGIMLLIRENQDPADVLPDGSYGSYYQTVAAEESLTGTYELLACFKKDMHKVETYLMVAKCRLFPEANCTM